jgi:cystathionine beta-lyase
VAGRGPAPGDVAKAPAAAPRTVAPRDGRYRSLIIGSGLSLERPVNPEQQLGPDTLITHAGRDPRAHLGIVNPPVYHCSTVLFPDYATVLETRKDRASGEFRGVTYGREGTPLTRYFEEAVAALEGGHKAVTLPCGMGAIAATLTGLLRAGDHLLVLDAVYGPCRDFCSNVLTRFGVEVEYYDPLVGAGIARLMRPNTRVVYVESPCSLTFEVQDIPAIVHAAHAGGAKVVMDNTWASPLFFRAIGHGVDVAIHAATKYLSGHSDLMLGVAVTTRETDTPVRQNASRFGYSAGPDDVYNALRGLRTLGVRMRQHQAGALEVARWLQTRPEVNRVLYPALPEDPGHALWQRDFAGASSLMGVVLEDRYSRAQLARMLDALKLFGLGYSWGGFESLAVPTFPETLRSATEWRGGPSFRLHVGLEDTRDLLADLEQALAKLD